MSAFNLPAAAAAEAAAEGGAVERRTIPRIFVSELRGMMFGFGDSLTPSPASLQLMEEMVIEYIVALVTKTMDVAASRRRDRPDVTDVKFAIRKDDRKMQRVRYLLDMQAHIQTVTKEGKNLTASYAEEAAAAAAAGAPAATAAGGAKGAAAGSATAAGGGGGGAKSAAGSAHPPTGGAKAAGSKMASVGGSGRASALKPPPAPR
ncbi:hypothetical protein BU14_1725s0002 [Porphyra umbilicalis]|uniref:Transcription initiation factor TFIID subunit 13 n=1 Tax=Porphyra umbilicalis TaxID=2786 RepID=A0A1X6NKX1_PORUM|nr:hypothetical protein BU14_1725s0002 [Porphyra umbilicalis]|eukprot:OSX69222.1 hypothetical protein BU14_1725s0002 [Porphyra umbilicalis]